MNSTESSGGVEHKTNANCPGKHGLTHFKTPKEGFGCDSCSKTMGNASDMFGCRTCNYDLCIACSESIGRYNLLVSNKKNLSQLIESVFAGDNALNIEAIADGKRLYSTFKHLDRMNDSVLMSYGSKDNKMTNPYYSDMIGFINESNSKMISILEKLNPNSVKTDGNDEVKHIPEKVMCYCGGAISRKKNNYSDEWICKCCYSQPKPEWIYECGVNDCVYYTISGGNYYICCDCYDRIEMMNSTKKDEMFERVDGNGYDVLCVKAIVKMNQSSKIIQAKFEEQTQDMTLRKHDSFAGVAFWVGLVRRYFWVVWMSRIGDRFPNMDPLLFKCAKDQFMDRWDVMVGLLPKWSDIRFLEISKEMEFIFTDYDGAITTNNNDNSIMNESDSQKVKITQMEWMAEIGQEYENDYLDCYDLCSETPNNIYNCTALKRIQFIHKLYDDLYLKPKLDGIADADAESTKHALTFVDIWNHSIFKYNNSNLINDLNHIADDHIAVSSSDVTDLMDGILLPKCSRINGNDVKCGASGRKYRDKDRENEKDNAELYGKRVSHDEHYILIDSMDKIHCFLYHRDGVTGKRNADILKFELAEQEGNEEKKGNGKDDDGDDDDDDDDDLDEVYARMGNSKVREMYAKNEGKVADKEQRTAHSVNHSKFVTVIDDDQKSGDMPEFSFGQLFYYWYGFTHVGNYIPRGNHANLKQECMNNKWERLTLAQWNRLILNAAKLRLTRRGKSMFAMDQALTNRKYEMNVGTPVSIGQLASVLLYTNYTAVQYKYKKFGCRLQSGETSYSQITPRNREILNWMRLFTECLMFFGKMCTPNEQFFHGLSCKLLFSQFSPKFCLPLSTTDDIQVASGFGGAQGIVLVLSPMKASRDRYLSVAWMSAYPEERENVFHRAFKLEISDIRECNSIHDSNMYFLSAIMLIDRMFLNEFCIGALSKKHGKMAQKCLVNFIQNNSKSNLEKQKSRLPYYLQQLFDNFVKTKIHKKLVIIKSEYDALKSKTKKLLVGESDGMELSPFVRAFSNESSVCWGNEFSWVLEGAILAEFKALLPGQKVSSGVHYCGDIEFTLFTRKHSAADPNLMGFGLRLNKCPKRVTFTFSYLVPQTKFVSNRIKCANMRQNDYKVFNAFPNKLVMDLQSLEFRVAMSFPGTF